VPLGKLRVEFQGRFRQRVEKTKARGGLQRAGETLRRGRRRVVADGSRSLWSASTKDAICMTSL
jgi:hypothetical protein